MTIHAIQGRFLLAALCLALGTAWAQPLATFAPAEALQTISYRSQPDVLQSLDDDLAALDWEGARTTLLELARLGQARSTDAELNDMLSGLEQLLLSLSGPEAAAAGLLAFCPDYQTVMNDFSRYADIHGKNADVEVLETISISPFNPIPAVTVLMRVNDDELVPLYQNAADTLLACAQASDEVEFTRLEQGGVPFYVFSGAGSPLPLAVAAADNLYAFSSNPDVLRGVLRRVQGSDEPSLADTELYRRAAELLGDEGLGLSLNFAALADLAEGMRGMLASGPEAEYLFNRATAALRTLGGLAARVQASDEGLLLESIIAVNPQGGDSELAELLLCPGCRVSRPALLPAQSVAVSGQVLPLRDLFRYLQSWASGAEAFTGGPVDLKALLREEFGFDIDRALFDWIGNEVYTLTLEPPSDRLGTLLYGREQVWLIPVTSQSAAEAGLEHWGEALVPLLNELSSDPLSDLAELEGLLTVVAERSYEYRGTQIRRIQSGFNLDLGIAFVGGYLAVGTPAEALETVIDTAQGAQSLLGSPALAGLPSQLVAFSYSDTQAVVGGLADLLDVFSQPAAFGIQAALLADGSEEDTALTGPYGFPDLAGITPVTVDLADDGALEFMHVGTLSEDMVRDEAGSISAFYELQGLSAGDEVTLELTSEAFDTYLLLIDAERGGYLAENDDAPDTSRSELSFTVQPGVRYWVEVSSWESATGNMAGFEGSGTGDYTLTVSRTPSRSSAGAPEVEITPPSYADLLNLTEILPRALEVIAEHLGSSRGYSEIRDNTIYRRNLTEVDW